MIGSKGRVLRSAHVRNFLCVVYPVPCPLLQYIFTDRNGRIFAFSRRALLTLARLALIRTTGLPEIRQKEKCEIVRCVTDNDPMADLHAISWNTANSIGALGYWATPRSLARPVSSVTVKLLTDIKRSC
jgi:hypothetical protein